MTIVYTSEEHGSTAECDGCPKSDPAMCHTSLDGFQEWETLPWTDGTEVHLCPRCQEKRERGHLAHDFVLVCLRCDRSTVDNPELTQWWQSVEGGSVCDDCYDQDRDAHRL